MKTVLVISPHFPPVNAADMHRVRISLRHFKSFGWNPVVLAVAPRYVESVTESLLLKTLPGDVPVSRVSALPARVTRKIGLGNVGLRAFPFLYMEGCRLIRKHRIDLIYFSTTMFPVLPLGRLWKRKFGIPFVIDIQDPWVSEYYASRPGVPKPPKYWAAARMHRILEPWTMQAASGLVAVSADYINTLRARYPSLRRAPAAVIPFGAAQSDFELIRNSPQPNRFSGLHDDKVRGVYLGRGGADMAPALRIVFAALKRGIEIRPDLFSRVRLLFVGTSYAPADRATKTVERVAREFGVQQQIEEHPARIPYFEGLQLLLDSDFLIVPGSDDPQYTASKIYPYILARKPLLAVFHHSSSVCGVLRATQAGDFVAFGSGEAPETYARELLDRWAGLLDRIPFEPNVDWGAFAPYSEIETARQQCQVFSQIAAR